MKKILTMLVVSLFVLFLSAHVSLDDKIEEMVNYVNPIYGESLDEIDIYEHFDYVFIGQIKSSFLTRNEKARNNELPETYFYVETLLELKGDLKNKEIIKFVGGYDADDNLVLLDKMQYPIEDAHYLFFAQAPDSKTNRGLDKHSLVIYHEKMMTKLEGFIEGYDLQYQNDDIINIIESYTTQTTSYIIDDGIVFDGVFDGGTGPGEPSNISMTTAPFIHPNTTYKANFMNGHALYYKIHNSDLNAYGFYSFNRTNNVGVVAELLDANGNMLTLNADASQAFIADGYGLTKTTSPHFYMNYTMRPNRTYFLRLTPAEFTPFGSVDFKFEIDNVMLGAYEDFLLPGHSVPRDRQIYYRQNSKYTTEVNEAIEMWNELETIQFIQQTGGLFSRINLTIRDYHNSSSGVILGTYNWTTNVISLNTYYLDAFFKDSRLQVVLHELGHAIGIDHTPYGNIMYYSVTWQQHIGPTDIAVYRQRWS